MRHGIALGLIGLLSAVCWAQDIKKLEGTWVVKGLKIAGTDAPDTMRAKGRVIIQGNKLSVKGLGTTDIDYSIELKPGKEKSNIDLQPLFKGVEAKPNRGIYKLEKSILTLCVTDDEERPTEFDSKPKSTTVLMILERAE